MTVYYTDGKNTVWRTFSLHYKCDAAIVDAVFTCAIITCD